TLQKDFTVTGFPATPSGNTNADSFVTMSSATIAGAGGKLIFDPGAKFTWSGGTIQSLTVVVQNGASMVVPGGGATPLWNATRVIDVKGTLSWEGGDVAVWPSNPRSMVHVFDGGSMYLRATGTWGGASLPTGTPKYFDLLNEGFVGTGSGGGVA